MPQRIDIGRRNHPSIPAGGVPPAGKNIKRSAQTLQAEATVFAHQRAVAASLIHKGRGECIDLRGRIENPAAIASVVNFTPPNGHVARVDAIAVWYSDPLIPACRAVGWNLMVNGERVPSVMNTEDAQRYDPVGDLSNPIEISPVWIQTGERVSIDVFPLYTFDCALTIVARLSGRLYRISGPNILAEV